MTKLITRYFYCHDETRTVYYSTEFIEDRPDLIYLGSTANPNLRMAAAAFTHKFNGQAGWSIKPID